MRPIQVLVFFSAVLLSSQAENDAPSELNARVEDNPITNNAATNYSINGNTEPVRIDPQNSADITTSAGKTSDQLELIMTRPDGPGIHAGFQASGPNFATTLSGGVKSTGNGATLETGFNFAGRLGDSSVVRSSTQQPANTQQHQSGTSSAQQRETQGASAPLDGATFAVSYKPGLLSAITNVLNPMRMFQQIGNTLPSFTGFGQGNTGTMAQAQTQQYSPPQTWRSMSSSTGTGTNGVGITWKPLYRAFW